MIGTAATLLGGINDCSSAATAAAKAQTNWSAEIARLKVNAADVGHEVTAGLVDTLTLADCHEIR